MSNKSGRALDALHADDLASVHGGWGGYGGGWGGYGNGWGGYGGGWGGYGNGWGGGWDRYHFRFYDADDSGFSGWGGCGSSGWGGCGSSGWGGQSLGSGF